MSVAVVRFVALYLSQKTNAWLPSPLPSPLTKTAYVSYLPSISLPACFDSHHFSPSSIMFSKTSLVAAAMGLFLASTGKCTREEREGGARIQSKQRSL